jgi:hypothetical protein
MWTVLLLYIAQCFVLDHLNIVLSTIIMSHFNFPVLSLHILYIQRQNYKYINCIINCNNVSFSYFPHHKLLYIMYTHLQNMKYIINCNIVTYIYIIYIFFPHILFLHILYIHLENYNYIKCIINCNIVPY